MHTLTCRVSDDLFEELEGVSGLLNRDKSFIVRKALEEYLEEYADFLVARERLLDKNEKAISSKELRKRLGL